MEKFYKEWTLPVKAWALSYTFGILYACTVVYLLMKQSTADEKNPALFNQIVPMKKVTDTKEQDSSPLVPVITQLKSYCGSTGTISHKQVEHYAEDPTKGELLIQPPSGGNTEFVNPYLSMTASEEAEKLQDGMVKVILSLIVT